MRITTLALALTLAASSCGGAADPASLNSEGYASLNSGNHAAAAGKFEAALDALGSDTSGTEYLRAKMGLIEANVQVNPDAAKDDFLALAQTSSTITAKDYSRVGSLLADAKNYEQAVFVVDAGIQAHPETPNLQAIIERIKADAASSGDSGAMNALEGLGYIGD